jgi:hypothetical protein
MVLGWVPFKIVSDRPALHSRWLLLLKIEISLAVNTPASSTTKTGRHDIAESGVKHQKSNQINQSTQPLRIIIRSNTRNKNIIMGFGVRIMVLNATSNNISELPTMVKQLVNLSLAVAVECTLFSSPDQRPCELLPSLGVRRTS